MICPVRWSNYCAFNFHFPNTMRVEGFHGDPCGKESAQCRRHRFHRWSRRIPHRTEQLSLWVPLLSLCSWAQELQLLSPHAAATEPTALALMPAAGESAQQSSRAQPLGEWPTGSTTTKKMLTAMEDQHSHVKYKTNNEGWWCFYT